MLTKGVKKYFANPVLGLMVSIVFIVLCLLTTNMGLSFFVSIAYALLSDIFLRNYTGVKISGLIFRLSLAPLVISFVLWVILKNSYIPDVFYLLFFEMLIVCTLVIARLSRIYIHMYLGAKQSAIQKAFFAEFFEIARLAEYALTFHLFVVLLYRLVRINYKLPAYLDISIYFVIPIVLLLAIIIYQEIKIKSIVDQLRKEEWLPIVSESGEVTGRIAKSVSMTMNNKFLHPVIRVALIHDGRIYLHKRSPNDSLAPGTYDYPFEKFMLFNNEIHTAARNCIANVIGELDFQLNYLLKYVYENEKTKRLVFLFFTRPETPDQVEAIRHLDGKFWSSKQIEENFVDEGFFCECFELEYEYLKNTVLQSDQLLKNSTLK